MNVETYYNAGVSELERANEFIKNNKWEEALSLIDKILDIPHDEDAAVVYLQEKMKSSDMVCIKAIPLTDNDKLLNATDLDTGQDVQAVGKIKMMIGGGATSQIIQMRGNCLINILSPSSLILDYDNVVKGKEVSYVPKSSNPQDVQKFNDYFNKIFQHLSICTRVFTNDPVILTQLGIICLALYQLDFAEGFLMKSFQLFPNNLGTIQALEMLRRIKTGK